VFWKHRDDAADAANVHARRRLLSALPWLAVLAHGSDTSTVRQVPLQKGCVATIEVLLPPSGPVACCASAVAPLLGPGARCGQRRRMAAMRMPGKHELGDYMARVGLALLIFSPLIMLLVDHYTLKDRDSHYYSFGALGTSIALGVTLFGLAP
jgi:hypothetical protein